MDKATDLPETVTVNGDVSRPKPMSANIVNVLPKFDYNVVQGYFIQNGPQEKCYDFEQMLERSFGLIDTSPERWRNLKASIASLQTEAPPGVQYKVLFLGRHGQGWHNAAKIKYGAEAWDNHWTRLYGDDKLKWAPDPELTPFGIEQAKAVQGCWRAQHPLGAPVTPDEMKWLVSPLSRAGQTLVHSFGDLLGGKKPEVWEDWDECHGLHPCDMRSIKTDVQEKFPDFAIEEGMTEHDELWKPDERENAEQMRIRMTRALDRVFQLPETYISITAHSEIFKHLLVVIGHQPYRLESGEMIPIVVKATRQK